MQEASKTEQGTWPATDVSMGQELSTAQSRELLLLGHVLDLLRFSL